MKKLFGTELYKVWGKRGFLVLLAFLLTANLLILWVAGRITGSRASADAYRRMSSEMSGLTMKEKKDKLESEYELIDTMYKIQSVAYAAQWGDPQYVYELRQQYADIIEEYGALYESGEYLKYTDELYTEYSFIKEIKAEYEQAEGYDGFLDEINQKANQLSGISIFAEASDNYDQKNIEKTAEAYEGMRGIEISYTPQKGLMTALSFSFSDIILLFAMLVLSSVLVRGERDSGLLALVRSAPSGRTKTAIAKLLALGVSLFAIVLLLYGVNLTYCAAAYGLGELGRSIQSVPELMRSTLHTSVAGYIGLFLITKWLAAVVAGAWVMLGTLIAKRPFSGYVLALSLPVASWLIRKTVSATGRLNVIKYANLISLLETNELLGSYRNLYWFGSPISLVLVESVAAVLLLSAFVAAFLLVFEKAQLLLTSKRTLQLPALFRRKKAKKTRATSVTKQEAFKLYVLNGAGAVLVLMLVFQTGLFGLFNLSYYSYPEETYYRNYMEQIQGPYTQETYEWLAEDYKKFEPVLALESRRAKGEITEQQYWTMVMPYWELQTEMGVVQNRVMAKLSYVLSVKGAHLVYDTGYPLMLGQESPGLFIGVLDKLEMMAVAGCCALSFAGLFAMEKSTGMSKVVGATPLGRRYTVNRKWRVSIVAAILLALLSCSARWLFVVKSYGLNGLFVPLRSIEGYAAAPLFMNIFLMLLCIVIARLIACVAMMGITLVFSYKMGNTFFALFASSILFCMPLLLSLVGVEWAEWLGPYPLFHIGNLATMSGGIVLGMLMMLAWGAVALGCKYYLSEHFGRED